MHPTEIDVHPDRDRSASRRDSSAAARRPKPAASPRADRCGSEAGAGASRPPAPAKSRRSSRCLRQKPRLLAGAIAGVAAAAAAAFVVNLGGAGNHRHRRRSRLARQGRLESPAPRAATRASSFAIRRANPALRSPAGEPVPAGSRLKTDERTRAYIELGDGSRMVLDRGTELALAGGKSRQARLERGAIVADVAHQRKSDCADRATARLGRGAGDQVRSARQREIRRPSTSAAGVFG